MSKNNNNTAKRGVFATLGRWLKRMFFGASKELMEDDRFTIEKIESPSVMAVKSFFRRKLAVVALVVLISMFLFVFIGPYCFYNIEISSLGSRISTNGTIPSFSRIVPGIHQASPYIEHLGIERNQ
jgi:hypothetical protein